jgi:diacylglycerol kinase
MLVLAIGLVISAEAMNTAIEILADRITLESDPAIGRAKDVAAGAVLAAAACSIVLGLLVFVPHLLACLS